MTLFAPDDLQLDDPVKFNNRLREMAAPQPQLCVGKSANDQVANDDKQSSRCGVLSTTVESGVLHLRR